MLKNDPFWAAVVFCLLLADPGHAKPMDGMLLESASMLGKGIWDFKFGLDYGSGAEPIEGPFLTATSKNPVEVDPLVVPFEMRYAWSDRTEIGWGLAFEADKGQNFPAGSNIAGTFFDASGLQSIRLLSKWKFRPRLAVAVDFAFAGKNTLMYGSDGLDMGVKFSYGPKIGPGVLLFNAGVLIKSGGGDFNNNKSTGASEKYQKPLGFGVGYICPFGTRVTGVFEFLGQTSPFAGGSGFTTNDLLSILIGMRYGFSDRFYLNTAVAGGAMGGSPAFSFRLGLNWLLGLGGDRRVAQAAEDSDFWAPSADDKRRVEKELAEQERRMSAPAAENAEERTAKAVEAFNRRDYVSAIAHYEAAVAMKKDDPLLYYNLATTFFLMRRYFEARPHYQSATRLNPSDVDSHLYLGYTLFYLKDTVGAAREWKTVLDLDPSNSIARDNLASLEQQ